MENLTDILNLDPNAKTKVFKKGQIIQFEGDAKPLTFFVKTGLLRSYIIDSKGKEHIFMFAPENWIIADVEAIENKQPVELFIDCLEDSEVIIFNKDSLFTTDLSKQKMMDNAQLLYRRMAKLQRRVLMLLGSLAIDRYTYFLNTYPELPNRVPQRMIASYLGITPQALSTIRGEMVRGK